MNADITTSASPSTLEFSPACPGPWSLIAAIEAHRGMMSAADLAVIVGKSKFTIYRMAKRREIPSLIIGGSRCFDPAALAQHYRRKSPQSAAAADRIAAMVA